MTKTIPSVSSSAVHTKTYMLDGLMTAESHLATCGPALKARAGKSDPTPIPILINSNGKFLFMPGAGFRSKLRGAATMLTLQASRQRSIPIMLSDAQYLRLGGVKQAGVETQFTVAEQAQRLLGNPMISVFGSSTPWTSGKLMVGHQVCVEPIGDLNPMQVDGVRSSMLDRNPEIFEFLDPSAKADFELQSSSTKASVAQKKQIKLLELQLKSLPRDNKDEATVYRKQIAALKGEGKIIVSEQMPLEGYLAIPPGARLRSTLRLLNATQIELGCLISSLELFALTPVLGGHKAHGAGEVSATWAVRASGSGQEIGTLEIDPFVGLKVNGDVLVDAKAAFSEFIESAASFSPRAPALEAAKEEKAGVDNE